VKKDMTKADLINLVHETAGGELTKKKSEDVTNAVFDAIRSSLKDEGKFTYPKFGTFTVKHRAARDGRNPKTGETIKIAAQNTVTFKPATDLKSSVQS
jgi:DNA-binding protein HU-beta